MISSNHQFEGVNFCWNFKGCRSYEHPYIMLESSTPSSLHDQVECREPHVLRRKILMKPRIYSGLAWRSMCAGNLGTLSMQPLTFNHSSKALEHLVNVCMWVIAGWGFRVSNTKTVRNNCECRLLIFIYLGDLIGPISSTVYLQISR